MKYLLTLLSFVGLLRAEGVPYSGLAAADREGGGVLVSAVAHFGPADRGGVNAGDTLLTMDGKPVTSKAELYAFLAAATPGQQITFTLQRRHLTLERRIIIKSGSWFSYGEMRMAQGRENARLFLKDNPEVCAEIEARIRAEVEEQRKKQEAEAEAKRQAREAMKVEF